MSSVSPAVRWSRHRESNSDAPKRTGSQPVAYAVSAMSGECTGRASNPQCPKAHASEACVFAGFTTCASSEARVTIPAKRACRARGFTCSTRLRVHVRGVEPRLEPYQGSLVNQTATCIGAGPEDRTLLKRFVRPPASPDAHVPRWSGRLESNQHGPAPEAGGQPLSHARIGSPSWSRTTLASFKERNAATTPPGKTVPTERVERSATRLWGACRSERRRRCRPCTRSRRLRAHEAREPLLLHAGGAPVRIRT